MNFVFGLATLVILHSAGLLGAFAAAVAMIYVCKELEKAH